MRRAVPPPLLLLMLVPHLCLAWHATPATGRSVRVAASPATPVAGASERATVNLATAIDGSVLPLKWTEAPQNMWTFDGWNGAPGLKVHYYAAGPEDAQPFLLIHGFGASHFHWRRNINVLAAAGYRVYAIDLVGFGLSSKPVIEYDST
eukprot:419084-Prymnesium_polylepis.1